MDNETIAKILFAFMLNSIEYLIFNTPYNYNNVLYIEVMCIEKIML